MALNLMPLAMFSLACHGYDENEADSLSIEGR